MSRAVNKDDETHEWWRRWRLLTMIRVLVESRGSIRAAIVCGGRYDFNLSSPASGSVGGHSLRSPLMASISHSSAVLVWSCNGPYLCDHLPARLLPEGPTITDHIWCMHTVPERWDEIWGRNSARDRGRERKREREKERARGVRQNASWEHLTLQTSHLFSYCIYAPVLCMHMMVLTIHGI